MSTHLPGFVIFQLFFQVIVYSSNEPPAAKATPIYLLVLRAQEVGNEPFWNKNKKLKNVTFLFILFFLESAD